MQVALVWWVFACGARVAPQVPTAPPVPAPAAVAALPPPPDCTGLDERVYGSACCTVRGVGEDRFPGQVFLSCRGPRIGAACSRRGDCDVACACAGEPAMLRPSDHYGPPAGTPGQAGVCAANLQAGVWRCELDENGLVTHVIVD